MFCYVSPVASGSSERQYRDCEMRVQREVQLSPAVLSYDSCHGYSNFRYVSMHGIVFQLFN